MAYICMLNSKLSNSFFFYPILFCKHICVEAQSPSLMLMMSALLSPVSATPGTRRLPAIAIHPAKVPPLRAPGKDIPEVELLTHRALQPPAGLACANLFCSASARVHTGHLGGVWSSTFSRVLTIVTFQCSPKRFDV